MNETPSHGDLMLAQVSAYISGCTDLEKPEEWEQFRQRVGPMGPTDDLIPYEVLAPIFAIVFNLTKNGAHLAQAVRAITMLAEDIVEVSRKEAEST